MIANFSWVIPAKLAGFGVLGMPSEADLHALRSEGVGTLVSLTEESLDEQLVQEAGMRYLHLPIPDMQAPSLGQIQAFVDFVDQAWTEGQPTATHCLAGLGRTGTMIACYLIHEGQPVPGALAQLRAQRPGSVETASQIQAIHEFARSLNVPG